MKSIVLFNPKSGSVPADARAKLTAVLREGGINGADLIESDPGNCENQLKELADMAPDLFVVWGGDGTIRSALTIVGPITPNLLILPGGTMNLLPRSIHGEKAWDMVLRDVLKGPKLKSLSAGEVNGDRFYCAMMAGAPAYFAEARESVRRGDLARAAAQTGAAIEVLKTMHLQATYGDGYSFAGTALPTSSFVGAIIGSLTKAGRGMEVASLANPTTTGAMNVVWTSFFTDWRNAPGVEVAPATSLDIGAEDGGDIPVIADGEHMQPAPHLHVTFVENASRCLTGSE
jgi:diacylglycerol kinase family enzyme